MRPTSAELTDVWLHVYSRTSLLEADRAIDALRVLPPNSATLAQALMCSIVVAYARPFTKSQITKDTRVIPLNGIDPPSMLASTHCMLLKLRDKVFGNIVLIKRVPSDFHFHSAIVADIAPSLLTEIKELCSFFVAHCISRLAPFIARYRADIMQRPEGFYELVVCEPPADWLRRHDKA